MPSSRGKDGLQNILAQNNKILDYCASARLGLKQYLPHYSSQEGWRAHFGSKWKLFLQRKKMYDPLAILGPGHRIFQKAKNCMSHDTEINSTESTPGIFNTPIIPKAVTQWRKIKMSVLHMKSQKSNPAALLKNLVGISENWNLQSNIML